MVDLTPIVALLQSFGPWGWIAAAALLLIQMRRNGGKSPLTPSPNGPAVPGPVLPEIDDLLQRLRERLKQRFPNAAPFFATTGGGTATGGTLAEQYQGVVQAIEARRAELVTELRSLPGSKPAGD